MITISSYNLRWQRNISDVFCFEILTLGCVSYKLLDESSSLEGKLNFSFPWALAIQRNFSNVY